MLGNLGEPNLQKNEGIFVLIMRVRNFGFFRKNTFIAFKLTKF